MWNSTRENIDSGYRYVICDSNGSISYLSFLSLLENNENFRTFLITLLRQVPFSAFRWETPAYTKQTLGQPFEFVVLDAPSINRTPSSTSFDEHLKLTTGLVARFQSLGKDAHLVVPACVNESTNYCHLAAFTQSAPDNQQQELWRSVGATGTELASASPVWLSTAGGGVPWLHIRFDSRPKYYHHQEYKR